MKKYIVKGVCDNLDLINLVEVRYQWLDLMKKVRDIRVSQKAKIVLSG
jgi:hypothetical protein